MEEKLVRYRVLSGQVQPYIGKADTFKKGQVFKGPPNCFTSFEVECLDEIPGDDELDQEPCAEYKLMQTGRWWSVVDGETEDAINDKGMTKEEAEALLKDLNGK